MQTVIDLIKEKNNHLEKFFRLNEAELLNFTEGNFNNLENFYNSREGLLDLIKKFDELIEEATPEEVEEVKVSDDDKKELIQALDFKNEIVTRILSQDLQVLSFIEEAKSSIIKELSEVRATRKAMQGYKSPEPSKRLSEKF